MEQLTDTPERSEFQPDWAPSGEFVAYVASFVQSGDVVRELFRMNPDGTQQTQLTELGGFISEPAVQP